MCLADWQTDEAVLSLLENPTHARQFTTMQSLESAHLQTHQSENFQDDYRSDPG